MIQHTCLHGLQLSSNDITKPSNIELCIKPAITCGIDLARYTCLGLSEDAGWK